MKPLKRVDLQSKPLHIVLAGLLTLGGLFAPTRSSAKSMLLASGAEQSQATIAARFEQRQQQVNQIKPEKYNLQRYPVIDSNERYWRHQLWATAIVEPQEPYVAQALNGILALTTASGLSRSQIKTVDMAMQVGTQLYLSSPTIYANVGHQFLHTIERSDDPQWVAMALSGLARSSSADQLKQLSHRVKARFPQWSKDIFLQTTLREVAESSSSSVPPLKDLLSWSVSPNQLHLYVICRPDRGVLCQALLKNRRGQFVRENGQLWSVPLGLRSLHGLGWNFVRGQTPQGIYRIEGVVPQPDNQFFRAYGQFSLVNLFVPFEPGAREFLPGRSGSFKGTLSAYQELLPSSWRNYFPIQQSYWAGKIGRSLFRIHGSGEAPSFFSNNQRYPASSTWNPTIGCLSALELYDEAGKLQQADMPKVLQAMTLVGGKNFSGYMIVVDIPSTAKTSISPAELEAAVR